MVKMEKEKVKSDAVGFSAAPDTSKAAEVTPDANVVPVEAQANSEKTPEVQSSIEAAEVTPDTSKAAEETPDANAVAAVKVLKAFRDKYNHKSLYSPGDKLVFSEERALDCAKRGLVEIIESHEPENA